MPGVSTGLRMRAMPHEGTSRALALLLLLAALLATIATSFAFAHEGHEHGTQAAASAPDAIAASEGARFAAQGRAFEIVAANRTHDMAVYVDVLTTNEPVNGAIVEIELGAAAMQARETEPGLYVVPQSLPPGKHTLRVRVSYGGYDEDFAGSMDVAQPEAPARTGAAATWIKGGAIAGMGFGLAMLALWNGRRRAGGALLLGLMAILFLATNATGHDGPHPAAQEETIAPAHPADAVNVASPPVASLTVSKATQRLIGVRTLRAHIETLQDRVELAGRIIADPNGFARVQAERDGRIEPPESGFPHIGQRVEKGALLGYLVPVLTTSEESTLQQTLAQIERDSALLVTKSDSVGIVNPNMPMTEAGASLLQELQIQAEALRRQKDAVLSARKKIAVNAPLAGVISKIDLAAGQIVAARERLIEIVDPAKKLVETFSFDGATAKHVAGATVEIGESGKIELAWLGTAPVLKQLATPMLFRPQQAPAEIEIGTPARVFVRLDRTRSGIVLPRDALTRDARGQWLVWEHTEPETFVAHAVTPAQIDASHVLVSGFAENARLVVAGAGLLGQAR